jgi:hypothetical protein
MNARPKQDFLLLYAGYFRQEAMARIMVFDRADGSKDWFNEQATKIVVIVQLEDCDGLSISNGSERLVTELLHNKAIKSEDVMYVEYYPADHPERASDERWDGGESFGIVTFERWAQHAFSKPGPLRLSALERGYLSITREDLEELIGGVFVVAPDLD